MRILFMGTPAFAECSLKALLAAGHDLCGVVCQPDKPVGRHQTRTEAPPVKVYAAEHGIPVFQPTNLRDGATLSLLRDCAPELIVVAAYGRILPQTILALPPIGCINVHSSLLPKYRGAAPINWAILNGERETGVTIMHMTESLDAGDIIAREKTEIGLDETAPELYNRLAEMGGALLVRTVEELAAGTAKRVSQNEEDATLAPLLSKALSPLDFHKPAWQLHNQVRGLLPWPCATAVIGGVRCKILKTKVDTAQDMMHGRVLEADRTGLLIACRGSSLRIMELQPDGKKPMTAQAFLAGHPLRAGTVLEWS